MEEVWTIHHLDADQIADRLRQIDPGSGAFIVLWDHDVPLGQRIILPGETTPSVEELSRFTTSRIQNRTSSGPCVNRHLRTTVVICTRDRPDDLNRCLRSLAAQTRKPDEIVVVDNAPESSKTYEIVQQHEHIQYVLESQPGLGRARNAGLLRSHGDIVAWCDDDIILHSRWLERLVEAFDSDEIMSVTGLVLPAELATDAQRYFELHWGFGRGYERFDLGPSFFAATRPAGCPAWQVAAGGSMAFRKRVFEDVGLFDERLGAGAAGCSEDSEICYRLLAQGWTCRYEPSAVSFHRHRRDVPELKKQIRAYMRGHTAALFVQYERYGHAGNLRRLFWTMPLSYGRRSLHRFLRGPSPRTKLLWEEVIGFLTGFIYYARHRQNRQRDRAVRTPNAA